MDNTDLPSFYFLKLPNTVPHSCLRLCIYSAIFLHNRRTERRKILQRTPRSRAASHLVEEKLTYTSCFYQFVNKAVSKMAIAEHDNVFIFVPNLIGKCFRA